MVGDGKLLSFWDVRGKLAVSFRECMDFWVNLVAKLLNYKLWFPHGKNWSSWDLQKFSWRICFLFSKVARGSSYHTNPNKAVIFRRKFIRNYMKLPMAIHFSIVLSYFKWVILWSLFNPAKMMASPLDFGVACSVLMDPRLIYTEKLSLVEPQIKIQGLYKHEKVVVFRAKLVGAPNPSLFSNIWYICTYTLTPPIWPPPK